MPLSLSRFANLTEMYVPSIDLASIFVIAAWAMSVDAQREARVVCRVHLRKYATTHYVRRLDAKRREWTPATMLCLFVHTKVNK